MAQGQRRLHILLLERNIQALRLQPGTARIRIFSRQRMGRGNLMLAALQMRAQQAAMSKKGHVLVACELLKRRLRLLRFTRKPGGFRG